jgi:hypothetical protein
MPRPPTARPCDATGLTRDTSSLSMSFRCLQCPRADAAPSLRDCGPFLPPPPTSPLPRGQRKNSILLSPPSKTTHCIACKTMSLSCPRIAGTAWPSRGPGRRSSARLCALVRNVTARFLTQEASHSRSSQIGDVENFWELTTRDRDNENG